MPASPPTLVNRDRSTVLSPWVALAWIPLTMLAYVTRSPAFVTAPDINGATFLLMGQSLLDGGVPYRDAWDHKGPLLYLLDAIGLALGGRWGVWAIDGLLLGCAVGLLFDAARRSGGRWVGLFAVLLSLASLDTIADFGNKTESYALVFHAAAIWAFCCMPSRSRWSAVIIGVSIAGCFWLRPNNAGPPGVAAMLLMAMEWRRGGVRAAVRCLLLGFVAFAGFTVVVLGLTTGTRGLVDMYDAYVVFNLDYSEHASWADRFDALAQGFHRVGLSAWLAVGAWLCIAVVVLRGGARPGRGFGAITRRLCLISLCALPIALASSSISGYAWRHYFLTWLPAVAITGACGAVVVLDRISRIDSPRRAAASRAAIAGMAAVLLITWNISAHDAYVRIANESARWERTAAELAPQVRGRKRLLVWGNDPRVNVYFDVPPCGRFAYIYPLLQASFVRDDMVNQLGQAIDQTRPLIIDTGSSTSTTPPLDSVARREWRPRRDNWAVTPRLAALMTHIDRTYRPIAQIESEGWVIYAPIDDTPSTNGSMSW
ncbi:MAG: hypothetical protein GC159_16885 [Phycisphaera sp.]|nr:hypothetical protein [Phycisphaera sp.]